MQKRLLTIISGGQTGADRAALDFAITNDLPHGGFCPKGRLAEDGPIAGCYNLQETTTRDYLHRTQLNVRETDATVVFTIASALSGGSKRTAEFAVKHSKPWLHLSEERESSTAALRLAEFIRKHEVKVLNVAGSRASKEPTIGDFVKRVLSCALLPTHAD